MKTIARRIDLSNHMFMIPANDPNHEVTECHTFQKDMYITSLTPHMHLRCKSMRIEVTYPGGREQTLLNVPEYNFNLGLASEPREDHAQYINSWLRVLKADKRAIFTAASKAQQATDWMVSRTDSRKAVAA